MTLRSRTGLFPAGIPMPESTPRLSTARNEAVILEAVARFEWYERSGPGTCPGKAIPCVEDLAGYAAALHDRSELADLTVPDGHVQYGGADPGAASAGPVLWEALDGSGGAGALRLRTQSGPLDVEHVHRRWLALDPRPAHPLSQLVASWQASRPRDVDTRHVVVPSMIRRRSKCAIAPKTWNTSSPAADEVSSFSSRLIR